MIVVDMYVVEKKKRKRTACNWMGGVWEREKKNKISECVGGGPGWYNNGDERVKCKLEAEKRFFSRRQDNENNCRKQGL